MDLTFGTNLQKRPLFLVTGVDGSNKVKTFIRSFMPSKQAKAFRWVIGTAMPTLLGSSPESTFKNVHMIATDEEDALISTVRSIFPNGVHRLDKYHLFIKAWKNEGIITSPTSSTIFKCIESWFHCVETVDEYDYSHTWLLSFLSLHKKELSEKNLISIQDIIASVNEKIKFCGHHIFMETTSFGFVGDSICESANSVIKSGRLAVNGRHSIETSALRQVQLTQEIEKKSQA